MNIVYFSGGIRGRRCLDALLRTSHQVSAVVASAPDEALAEVCRVHALPLHVERRPNSDELVRVLTGYAADLFVCAGYNRILKPMIFGIPPRGTLNLHGGRLPDYRGAAPINWQIINGETEGGCCVLYMDEGIDSGPIVRQELYPIGADDTHQSVLDRTLTIFPRLLLEALQAIEDGTVDARPQRLDEGCYYSRRFPEDSRIDWRALTDQQVHDLVRGMQGPYPHAFTWRGDERIDIEQTALLDITVKGIAGRVPLKRADGAIVICANRGILVREVRIDGERRAAREALKIGETFN